MAIFIGAILFAEVEAFDPKSYNGDWFRNRVSKLPRGLGRTLPF